MSAQERSFCGKVALITGISLCFLFVGEYFLGPFFFLSILRGSVCYQKVGNFMVLGDLPPYSYVQTYAGWG